MKKDATAVPRLNTINHQQLVLRTLDAERLVDDDHSVAVHLGTGGPPALIEELKAAQINFDSSGIVS